MRRRPPLSSHGAPPRRFARWACLIGMMFGAWGPASVLHADWLIARDGTRVETRGPWWVKGKQITFYTKVGVFASIRTADVDLDATLRLQQDRQPAPAATRDEIPVPVGVVPAATPTVNREDEPERVLVTPLEPLPLSALAGGNAVTTRHGTATAHREAPTPARRDGG